MRQYGNATSVGTSPKSASGKFEELVSPSHRRTGPPRLKAYQAKTYCEKIV